MKNWLRNKLRSWLGLGSIDNRIQMLTQDIGKLEMQWVASGPDKIKVATSKGFGWAPKPQSYDAQKLVDLITKPKTKKRKK